VADPRAQHGRRWKDIRPLLVAVITAICAGAKSLADLERMTKTMVPALRRRLGIARRIPDTTERDLLCKLEPRAVRGAIHAQIRAAHRRKALAPERLPFGVLVMDGKGTALTGCDDDYAQRQSQQEGSRFQSVLRTVTCTLASAAAKPCIDAVPIPASTHEMGHFPTALRELMRAYAPLDLFRLVSYDAGACSIENANLVREPKLHYLRTIAVDDTRVYLSDEKNILTVPKVPANKPEAPAQWAAPGSVVHLAVDRGVLFWTGALTRSPDPPPCADPFSPKARLEDTGALGWAAVGAR
jgi:hypothetical protein